MTQMYDVPHTNVIIQYIDGSSSAFAYIFAYHVHLAYETA